DENGRISSARTEYSVEACTSETRTDESAETASSGTESYRTAGAAGAEGYRTAYTAEAGRTADVSQAQRSTETDSKTRMGWIAGKHSANDGDDGTS
ncbi:MAG: hypothetical protein KAT56_02515, partial [Sedimentisphaerales bacterium]|nr:hypothetical protein [Sedimentisphaerales bacterium]